MDRPSGARRVPVVNRIVVRELESHGFVATVGLLVALYLLFETCRQLWIGVAAVVFVGLMLSNPRRVLVAGSLGAVVLLVRTDRRLGVGVIGTAIVALVASWFPFFAVYVELAQASLLGRLAAWRVVWMEAMVDPFIGEGFDTNLVIHNSYLSIVLHTGSGQARSTSSRCCSRSSRPD